MEYGTWTAVHRCSMFPLTLFVFFSLFSICLFGLEKKNHFLCFHMNDVIVSANASVETVQRARWWWWAWQTFVIKKKFSSNNTAWCTQKQHLTTTRPKLSHKRVFPNEREARSNMKIFWKIRQPKTALVNNCVSQLSGTTLICVD